MGEPQVDVGLIDAHAPALDAADLVLVFGTRLRAPALTAAELYERRLAHLSVITGGSPRQAGGTTRSLVAAGTKWRLH